MKKLVLYVILHFIVANEISIDLITTNDIHGAVDKQTAYFMNPNIHQQLLEGLVFTNI